MPGLVASSSKSEWVFDLRDTSYYDTDSDAENTDSQSHARRTVVARQRTSHDQLLKELDLSARDDSAVHVPNPWTIAKYNAACRPSVPVAMSITSAGTSDSLNKMMAERSPPVSRANNQLKPQCLPKRSAQTTLDKAFMVEKGSISKSTVSKMTKSSPAVFSDHVNTNISSFTTKNDETGGFWADAHTPTSNATISKLGLRNELLRDYASRISDSDVQSVPHLSSSTSATTDHTGSLYTHSDLAKFSPRSYAGNSEFTRSQEIIANTSPVQKYSLIPNICPVSLSKETPDPLPVQTSPTCLTPSQSDPLLSHGSFFDQQPCDGHYICSNSVYLPVRRKIGPALTVQQYSRPNGNQNIKSNIGLKRSLEDDDPDSTWSTLPRRDNKRLKTNYFTKPTIKNSGKFRLPISTHSLSLSSTVTIDTEKLPDGKKLTLYKPPPRNKLESIAQPVILRVRKASPKEIKDINANRGLEEMDLVTQGMV